jgi:hypothetical protein
MEVQPQAFLATELDEAEMSSPNFGFFTHRGTAEGNRWIKGCIRAIAGFNTVAKKTKSVPVGNRKPVFQYHRVSL